MSSAETEEGAVPERGQDPPLHELDPGFYLRLVFRLSDTGGNDRSPIVNRQLLIGAVDAWLIATGLGHAGEEIIRDQDLGYTADELKARTWEPIQSGRPCVYVASAYVKLLAPRTATKIWQSCTSPRGSINDRNRLAAVINKQLLSCVVDLAHGDIELFCIGAVEVTELAILVALGILRFVLVPEKHQGDALSGKLPMDVCPDGNRTWGI